jgi:Zn-dependent peptidase ImmA (M78 family)
MLRHVASGDLARQMGWRAEKLSRLEGSDKTEIAPGDIERLAGVLNFPEPFFVTPLENPVRVEGLLFRAPKSMRKRERQFLAEYTAFAAEFCSWLDGLHRLPPVRFKARPAMDISYATRLVRDTFELAIDQPIGYLTYLIERSGVPVIVRRSDPREQLTRTKVADTSQVENHPGFSAWAGEFRERPLIAMRAVSSWERTRWTLAHEVGHVLLHHDGLRGDAEEEASRFAGELLAPIASIRDELPDTITLSALRAIKSRWGISMGALVRHLYVNNLISDERRRTLQRQLYTRKNQETGRVWGITEPGWDERSPERPRLLKAWVERCLGTDNPHAVAATSRIWPGDIIATILSEQRGAPVAEQSASPIDKYATSTSLGAVVPLRPSRKGS